MEKTIPKFIHDKYTKARGGKSGMLDILCAQCKTFILLYQKDGFKGQWLKRLYIDRIISAKDPISSSQPLVCTTCKVILGKPMIYMKEDRPAYSLINENIIRRSSKITL